MTIHAQHSSTSLAKRMCQRLASCAGDTLVESLAALLIAALATSALVIMVMSAVNVSTASEAAQQKSYTEQSQVADATVTGSTTITISMGSATASGIGVQTYKSTDSGDHLFARYVDIAAQPANLDAARGQATTTGGGA